jgi:CelD/BcsL family acetyltransferase involved in cellulose biosynthesis
MKIELIHQVEDLEALYEAWSNLLVNSITNTPFQRHEYQSVWWSTKGGGEWESGDLMVAAGWSDQGELMGLAPLFYSPNVDGETALLFLGSVEISDYLDLIVTEKHLDEFVQSLFDFLNDNGTSDWTVIDLYNIPESSPSLQKLSAHARARGWKVDKERLQPCPRVYLPDEWDAYLEHLGSKQSRELRRKLRKAEGYPATVDWHIVDDGADLKDAVDTLLSLMANDSAKAEFLTEPMREQFHRMCETAFEHDWLQIAFLNVSGKPIFGYVNFDYGNRIWVYNSGFDSAHFDLSPGWVLMGNIIQWSIEEGREAVDFLRGDESYKYRLGGRDRFIVNIKIRR